MAADGLATSVARPSAAMILAYLGGNPLLPVCANHDIAHVFVLPFPRLAMKCMNLVIFFVCQVVTFFTDHIVLATYLSS